MGRAAFPRTITIIASGSTCNPKFNACALSPIFTAGFVSFLDWNCMQSYAQPAPISKLKFSGYFSFTFSAQSYSWTLSTAQSARQMWTTFLFVALLSPEHDLSVASNFLCSSPPVSTPAEGQSIPYRNPLRSFLHCLRIAFAYYSRHELALALFELNPVSAACPLLSSLIVPLSPAYSTVVFMSVSVVWILHYLYLGGANNSLGANHVC